MPDMEKVIKELECCVSLNHNGSKCANCDYADEFHNGDCETYLLSDALALLKAQEPVVPIQDADDKEDDIFRCGACGAVVGETFLGPPGECEVRHNYCPECGGAVKWE